MSDLLIATDLDQTLLFSPAATARLGGALPARAVEVLDGVLISELADAVRESLQSLTFPVVPATTRTPAQLLRIDWPVPMPWAVAASGAVILRDGVAELAGAQTVWAAGDSLLDTGLVAAAARAWVPRGSPLAAALLAAAPLPPHVTVTAEPGHAAAAEMATAWAG